MKRQSTAWTALETWITENRQRNNRAVNAAFHGLASWYREW